MNWKIKIPPPTGTPFSKKGENNEIKNIWK